MWMTAGTRAAAVLLCGALVAGCSADPEPKYEEPSESPPTSSAPAPTTPPVTDPPSTEPPGPVEPELPAAAEAPTKAGAMAFGRHFISVIDYAEATGDIDLLASISGPTCSACEAGERKVREIYRRGGRIVTDGREVVSVTASRITSTDPELIAYRVVVRAALPGQRVEIPGREDQLLAAARSDYELLCTMVGGRNQWRLDDIEVLS